MNSGLLAWLVSLGLFFAFQAFLIRAAKKKDASITFWDLVVLMGISHGTYLGTKAAGN